MTRHFRRSVLLPLLYASCSHAALQIPIDPVMCKEAIVSRQLRPVASASRGDLTITRYLQHYQDIPLWGQAITSVRQEATGKETCTGQWIDRLQDDIPDIRAVMPPALAWQAGRRHIHANSQTRQDQSRLMIYLDARRRAHLVYQLTFLQPGSTDGHPHLLIDAGNGTLLRHWNSRSDSAPPALLSGRARPAISAPENTRCTLGTATLHTLDMRDVRPGTRPAPFSYDCRYPHTADMTRSLAFAHAYGTAVLDMFAHWYGIRPSQPVRLAVHYAWQPAGSGAFLHEETIYLPEGDNSTLSPAQVPDIIGHEIGHLFNREHHGPSGKGQPGAISESFADMAGEAAEFYLLGRNDWSFGASRMRDPALRKGLRDLRHPDSDGVSIAHASQHKAGMPVHQAAGVFNRAFYLLASSPGWDTRTAFGTFLMADRFYWHQDSDFSHAACGVTWAAEDLGQPVTDVKRAFEEVGVRCAFPRNPKQSAPA